MQIFLRQSISSDVVFGPLSFPYARTADDSSLISPPARRGVGALLHGSPPGSTELAQLYDQAVQMVGKVGHHFAIHAMPWMTKTIRTLSTP